MPLSPDPIENADEVALSDVDVEVLALLAAQAARRAAPPSDALRNRILTTARAERFAFIRDGAGIWISHDERSEVKELFHDSGDRAATRLVRLSAGHPLPKGSIAGSRSIFVIRGSIGDGATQAGAGDFLAEGAQPADWHATADSLLLEYANARANVKTRSPAESAVWHAIFPGARMRPLAGGHGAAQEIFVLDMAAHSALGEHDHGGLEELFVLRGSCVIEGQPMARGDYHRAAAGSHHNPTATDEGCLLVVSVRDLPRLAA